MLVLIKMDAMVSALPRCASSGKQSGPFPKLSTSAIDTKRIDLAEKSKHPLSLPFRQRPVFFVAVVQAQSLNDRYGRIARIDGRAGLRAEPTLE